jgi:hypothetical protein
LAQLLNQRGSAVECDQQLGISRIVANGPVEGDDFKGFDAVYEVAAATRTAFAAGNLFAVRHQSGGQKAVIRRVYARQVGILDPA